MTFEEWLDMADRMIIMRTGLDRESFPDWDWWNAFDDGLTYREAVNDFLEELQSGRL